MYGDVFMRAGDVGGDDVGMSCERNVLCADGVLALRYALGLVLCFRQETWSAMMCDDVDIYQSYDFQEASKDLCCAAYLRVH